MSNMQIECSADLLPAWFIERMTGDFWHFGLMTSRGTIICISEINRVYQSADGSVWIDVELENARDSGYHENVANSFTAPTSRTSASINTRHIVAAFEIGDT